MTDLILRQGRVVSFNTEESETVDIAIKDGQITAISPNLTESAAQEIDLSGKLISPPFVESHIHLDSVLTAGEPRWNESGTLFEGIQIWGDRKRQITIEDVKNRALTMLKEQAAQGILFVRTHADVSEPNLIALQALLELRDEVKDWMTVQVVAFPQDGIYSHQKNEVLLEKALEMGADAVGGIPHYELTREDGVRSIQRIFELAEKYNRLIDIHCDEIDDEQSRFLEVVTAEAIRQKNGSRVTASHTTAFGSYNNAYAFKLMGFLQRAQINFIANPLINITLQGRADTYPKRRGVTRVKELWQNDLNISFGHDCVQDPWYSLGTGSMLDVAHMGVHICHMTGRDEVNACYRMVTGNGAKTLNLENKYGIEVGKPASLIVLDAKDYYDAVRTRIQPRYVISQGKIIASTTPAATNFSLTGVTQNAPVLEKSVSLSKVL
ncbi:cytosine deaminase-like metal-dependent hydrolase [Rivularia sp. PCC 7116]|uniref:cytosine deaminase n=1 Tax=Rivularia sp. PCC 7116 TaxID=373994 RepID=UPI00029EE4A9|nr:cytosine deaminase [Rivularia sp. PCC 7116]AFY53989.1 cytosine deaminase-like metal-dependent hydrolase [Rivularia sp. PCC 7116]